MEDAHAFGISVESLPVSGSDCIGTCECLETSKSVDGGILKEEWPTKAYPFDGARTECARRVL